MYTLILQILINRTIRPNQHAYVPSRGVLTAWIQIVSRLSQDEDIYEFDLKGFFDNVDASSVIELLIDNYNIPLTEIQWLTNLLRNTPELPADRKLDETPMEEKLREQQLHQEALDKDFMEQSLWEGFDDMFGFPANEPKKEPEPVSLYRPSQKELMAMILEGSKDPSWSLEKFNEEQARRDMEIFEYLTRNLTPGLPQGAPFSPLLSILPLQRAADPKNTILYADDGLMFTPKSGPQPELHKACCEWAGIIPNTEKSGWVKRHGKWIKPLKFLGIEYNGKEFRASTRNGSDLEWTDEKRFVLWLAENWRKISHKGSKHSVIPGTKESLVASFKGLFEDHKSANRNWEEDFKSRFLGFAFSRLQGGSWNPEVEQDFKLRYTKRSLLDQKLAGFMRRKCINEKLTLYNSSTFATHCLKNDLDVEYNIRENRVNTIKHVGIRLLKEWTPNKIIRWVFTKPRSVGDT